jgi:photosystem II stability/assembly factor-like uncharacterized protein
MFFVMMIAFTAICISPQIAAIADRYDLLQATTATWELLEHDYPDAIFSDVEFVNCTHGWVIGRLTWSFPTDVVVLFTDDGGDSWYTQLKEPHQYITQIEVIDSQDIWITGRGALFHSDDGGETWNNNSVMGMTWGMATVGFINRTTGWTSTNDTFYKTDDGGQSWNSVPGWNFDDTPRKIRFLSPSNFWAIGWFGIYHSVDGGKTWECVSDYGGWTLSFVSVDEGWAVSDSALLHMTDGETWYRLPIPNYQPFIQVGVPYFADIQFVDSKNGWIVGDQIPIIYTPDGGLNWYDQSLSDEFYDRLYAVDFINTTHGWAVGSGGAIYRTTQGNAVGTRLWNGITDPVFLAIITLVIGSLVILGLLKYRRRLRRFFQSKLDVGPRIE